MSLNVPARSGRGYHFALECRVYRLDSTKAVSRMTAIVLGAKGHHCFLTFGNLLGHTRQHCLTWLKPIRRHTPYLLMTPPFCLASFEILRQRTEPDEVLRQRLVTIVGRLSFTVRAAGAGAVCDLAAGDVMGNILRPEFIGTAEG